MTAEICDPFADDPDDDDLDLVALAELLRATGELSEIDVALGLARLGILVLPTVPRDKAPMLTKAHIDGIDVRTGEIVGPPCEACRAAKLRPATDHGATTDPELIGDYWTPHPDAGVGMKNHSRLVRVDGDFASAAELKNARKVIGYGQSTEYGVREPFEAPTPGGTYRRRWLHVLPDGVPAPGGGTSMHGVSLYCTSGQTVVKGGHPNGGQYPPFYGARITELPEAFVTGLRRRSPTGASLTEATDAQVREFLDAHTGLERLDRLEQRRRAMAAKPVGDRHHAATGILAGAFRDTVAGYYPARLAHDTIKAALADADFPEARMKAEWPGIVAWAVGQVREMKPDDARAEIKADRDSFLVAVADDAYPEDYVASIDAEAARDLTVDEIDAALSAQERRLSDDEDEVDDEDDNDELDPKVAAALERIQARNLGLRDVVPPVRPLVEGVVDLATMVLLYARWGCFKSFLGIDWGLHVATGTPWLGHPVERRPFVILGYEAPLSLHRRARAWCHFHGVDLADLDGWFYLDRRPRPLTDPTERLAMRHYLDGIDAGFVMVDTLARSAVGVKSNTDEMLVVYDALGELVTDTRTVLGIGHAGKDTSRGMRGFSGQEDWADAVFALDRERNTGGPHGPATLTNSKQKDRDQLSAVLFDLRVVDLGDGGPPSAVIVPVEPGEAGAAKRPETVEEKSLNLVVEYLQNEDGWQPITTVTERCKRTNPKAKVRVARPDVAEAIERLVELGAVERNDRHEVRLAEDYDDE